MVEAQQELLVVGVVGPFEISGDVGAQKPVGELGRVGLIEASWLGSL